MTTGSIPPSPRALSGLADIAADYDIVLCDVWGVIHNGVAHHTSAVDALQRFRAKGGRVVLLTNAPNPKEAVQRRLDALAVPHDAYDAIVSSGDVTAAMIVARGDAPFFHIGPPHDSPLFANVERQTGRAVRRVGAQEADYVVCTGFFDVFKETPADYDPIVETMLQRRLDLICANPDIVVQAGKDLIFCAGAIAERYAARGGTVIHAGKPHRPIYEKALATAADILGRPIDRGRVLAIGDAMATDIAGGRHQGLATLFVASGIHAAEVGADAAAMAPFWAKAGYAPTAMLPDLIWQS